MQLRLLSIDDYDEVYALWLSIPGVGLNDVDDSRAGIDRYLQRNPDTCFVAIKDSMIAGVILASNDGRRGYIHHLAVATAHRNKGIGKQLVHAALDALTSIGISKVALVVFSENQVGNAFWERLGFTTREDLTYRNKALRDLRVITTESLH